MIKFKSTCKACSGSNITQQITFMVDPNNVPKQIYLDGNEIWDDWYWCADCEDDCKVDIKEVENN